MTQTVLLNLGHGSLEKGLPQISVQLWTADHPFPEQHSASLPANKGLLELYCSWQRLYQALCQRFKFRSFSNPKPDDGIEILDETVVTNISRSRFETVSQELIVHLNAWLRSESFIRLDQELRSLLSTTDPIRVIFETDNELLRHLPWHQWDLFNVYPNAEMALFCPEFKRFQASFTKSNQNVSILAIMGNAKDIDLTEDRKFLAQLRDATVKFLVRPSKLQLDEQLQHPEGWDILFFAGHSDSQNNGGQIYLDDLENSSLSFEELRGSLECAIANGLKLAIFNSCDGLGLAQILETLYIPVTIVMREPVPNKIAQLFLRHFLDLYARQHFSLYLAIRQARLKLRDVEDKFPGASWLPLICQNPALEAPSWVQLGGLALCPYRGLAAFQEQDAAFFFGREMIVASIVEAIHQQPLVALVGPSGSGKSSVVLAGVVPHLKAQSPAPLVIRFRPGNNPFQELSTSLAAAQQTSMSIQVLESQLRDPKHSLQQILHSAIGLDLTTPLVLIADQFEECFTLSIEADQQLFLERFLQLLDPPHPNLKIILTLRADFFGHALSYRSFSDVLQGSIMNLAPMLPSELAAAIEKPAAQAQVVLEKGLVQRLIRSTYDHPGRLPLLQFALTKLWSKQHRGLLTHKHFAEIGGVEEALAQHADQVYIHLSPADQRRAQTIFMQLVHVEKDMDVTRRLATRDDIKPENWDLSVRLATARLVVTNCDALSNIETVEVAHEALIRSWSRLRDWIQEDGAFRLWQEKLRINQHNWEENNQDPGILLRGRLLAEAEAWLQHKADSISDSEHTFILASKELQQVQAQLETRRLRILRLLLLLVSTALLGALGLGTAAFWQSQRATESQIEALVALSESLFTIDQPLDALIEAMKAHHRLTTIKDSHSALKSRVHTVLLQAFYGVNEYQRLQGDRSAVFSPDGSMIATSENLNLQIRSKEGANLATGRGHTFPIWRVAFSPNGQRIATASEDKTAKIWTLEGELVTTLKGHRTALRAIAFHPDGKMVATASDDGMIKLWTVTGQLLASLTKHEGSVWSLAFSPGGSVLASAGDDHTIQLWQVQDGRMFWQQALIEHQAVVRGLAFSPDSQTLISASQDKSIKLWSSVGRHQFALKSTKTLREHMGTVADVAFSPNGDKWASVSWDGTVKQWDLNGQVLQTYRGNKQRLWQVEFSPDGRNLLTSGEEQGGIKLWRLRNPHSTLLENHTDIVLQATFSPDGKLIASSSDDRTIRLWTEDGHLLSTMKGHEAGIQGLAFTPDSRKLVSSGWDSTIKHWQVNTSTGEYRLLNSVMEQCGSIRDIAFSHSARQMLSTCQDGSIKLWSQAGQWQKTLAGHNGEGSSIAISADDRLFASTSLDTTVKLWDFEGELVKTFDKYVKGVSTVDFHPTQPQIATGDFENNIVLHSLADNTSRVLKGHTSDVRKVSFHPDGHFLVSASADHSLKLWTLQGNNVATLTGHSGTVWDVNFSPDGRWLVSASEDGTVRLWQLKLALNTNHLIFQSCQWLQHYLKYGVDIADDNRNLCASVGTSEDLVRPE